MENQSNSIDAIKRNADRYDNIESAKRFLEGIAGTSHRAARHKKEYDAVSQFLQHPYVSTNNAVLDIGCSGGRYIQLFITNGFRPCGVDTSMTALRYANSLFGQSAVFSNASATHLPFKEDVFDIVLCVELLHHFDDCYLEKILGEISYLIKPGGTLICDVRNSLNPVLWHSYRKRDGRHFTLKTRSIFKMIKILKKCGFEVLYRKSLFFPISIFAPYVILFCKYGPDRKVLDTDVGRAVEEDSGIACGESQGATAEEFSMSSVKGH
ncbi:MAG: bifunctional 3-demethylubiquinone-9 3-methyltransferase/ 2-octaprenyl-6-hydroxy phenol methylase [Candidatus Methanolliviera sp. GoM_oil]|nr:MAG: bifunctional 3-demethylubiquinone-9 3-methyltransferase/ 2-octaprenyl-6-hydroxy phenol methylase [Candidatus Methanolliviera sp. GoM_oil]